MVITMIRFECDYNEGAAPCVMKILNETNFEQTPGYSTDKYCDDARQIIKNLCKSETADVHFLVGGTQANMTVISASLRPYQGVISAESGHINVHETGAIEATGHKILTLPSTDGKISAEQIEDACRKHYDDANHDHTVQPGMVYISFPTENGTVYSKEELRSISKVCKENSLMLFVDGARMGYGLMSEKNDLTLADFAKYCDVFYIGGTKQGMLFGEAVVITNEKLKKDFRYMIKRHGGMFAKGRLLGLQFKAMLETGEYFNLAKRADEYAMKIRKAFENKGYKMLFDSYTNQQYPILPNSEIERLGNDFSFSFWCECENGFSAVRFCTSWATKEDDVDKLINAL